MGKMSQGRSLEDMSYMILISYYNVTVIKIYGIFTGLVNRAVNRKEIPERDSQFL